MILLIKFRVLGKVWKLRILETKKYERLHGTDSVGITYEHKRTVDMPQIVIDQKIPEKERLEMLMHELFHVYSSEMCTKSTTRITKADYEEICADLFAKRAREMIAMGDAIMGEIKLQMNPPAPEKEEILHFSDENGDSPCGNKNANAMITNDYADVTCVDCKFKVKGNLS